MRYFEITLYVLLLIISGCTGNVHDSRLKEIAEQVSDSPREMQVRLDSIDVSSLKESDRYFHALLSIKAQDKAYVKHTSDSVILTVIKYYSNHKNSGLYPEALYYGGRVYSDLGDAPMALRYFQDALDALPEGEDNQLRIRILSQTSALLNSLRLYNEAIVYLKDCIDLLLKESDSINAMRNIQLLGAVYMHSSHYDQGEACFRKAREIAKNISHKDTVVQDMYIAANALHRGDMGTALGGIRSVISGNIPDKNRDIIYAYASQIYLEADIPDTAYFYALQLLESNNNDHKRIGYNLLLCPKLREHSYTDSLLSYTLSYREVLDEYLDRHDGEQVVMQSSLYNYQNHERMRQKAEKNMRIYMFAACGALFFVLVLCIIILCLRNRNMKTVMQYRKAMDDISLLKKTIAEKNEPTIKTHVSKQKISKNEKSLLEQGEDFQSDDLVESMSNENRDKEILRERLKNELLALQKAGEAKKEVPESIRISSAYFKLKEYLKAEKIIRDSDDLWCDLEKAVLNVSPNFKSGLYLLTGDKLKTDAYHMALLIKCGMTPTDLTVLIGRTKGAVSSRRGYTCEMIFGQKLGAKVMDDIIRLL